MRPDIKTEEPYRISRDKLNVLARAVAEALATLDGVEFVEDKNTVRVEVRRILEELRKRFGEGFRPQLELDYIERLLKDF